MPRMPQVMVFATIPIVRACRRMPQVFALHEKADERAYRSLRQVFRVARSGRAGIPQNTAGLCFVCASGGEVGRRGGEASIASSHLQRCGGVWHGHGAGARPGALSWLSQYTEMRRGRPGTLGHMLGVGEQVVTRGGGRCGQVTGSDAALFAYWFRGAWRSGRIRRQDSRSALEPYATCRSVVATPVCV